MGSLETNAAASTRIESTASEFFGCFDCFGVTFGIRVNTAEAWRRALKMLPVYTEQIECAPMQFEFTVRLSSVIGENHSFEQRGEEPGEFESADYLFDVFEAILRQVIAKFTKQRVFIHAGVVAWRDNLIVLPGNGFAGKTTLTAELVKLGAVYYSDEFAILDDGGLVQPYPKPLSLRRRDALAIGDSSQTDYDVAHFGGVQGTVPLAPKLVVITQFQKHARWRPQVLSPGVGVLEILKHTNSSLNNPEMALRVLQKVTKISKIIKSKRGDARKTAVAILKECE